MIDIAITEIEIGDRFRSAVGDINGLVSSIKEVGLLHPVVITKSNLLIAGRRRLEACKSLGMERIPVTVIDSERLKEAERDENEQRVSLTPTEALEVRNHFLAIEKEKAKERKVEAGQKRGRGRPKKIDSGNLPQPINDKARDLAAKATGYSASTLRKVEEIVAAAEKEPEKFAPVIEKMNRTKKVDSAYKLLKGKESLIPQSKILGSLKDLWLSLDKKNRREFIKWTKTAEGKEML